MEQIDHPTPKDSRLYTSSDYVFSGNMELIPDIHSDRPQDIVVKRLNEKKYDGLQVRLDSVKGGKDKPVVIIVPGWSSNVMLNPSDEEYDPIFDSYRNAALAAGHDVLSFNWGYVGESRNKIEAKEKSASTSLVQPATELNRIIDTTDRDYIVVARSAGARNFLESRLQPEEKRKKPHAVVLISPTTRIQEGSSTRAVDQNTPFLSKIMYSESDFSELNGLPVLVVHGMNDELVGFDESSKKIVDYRVGNNETTGFLKVNGREEEPALHDLDRPYQRQVVGDHITAFLSKTTSQS